MMVLNISIYLVWYIYINDKNSSDTYDNDRKWRTKQQGYFPLSQIPLDEQL